MLYVGSAALMRAVSGQRDERQFEQGRTDFGFERHLIGALGEYVMSKFLDVHFAPLIGRLDTDRCDVAGYQVRASTHPKSDLIVKRDAKPEEPYAHVRLRLAGSTPHAEVHGWILAEDAMRPDWWKTKAQGFHHSAYAVPVECLTKEFGS